MSTRFPRLMPFSTIQQVADCDTLRDIARRCENAAWPSRSLDMLIALGGNEHLSARTEEMCSMTRKIGRDEIIESFTVPHYTSSIDAAVTLVPVETSWEAGFWSGGASKAHAYVGTSPTIAQSPVLALCAAALWHWDSLRHERDKVAA